MKTKAIVCNFLLGACLTLTLNGCYLIKTVKVPVKEASLYPYKWSKPSWTIEDGNHKTWELNSVTIRHDSIFGTLYNLPALDHPVKNNKVPIFRRSNWPHSFIYLHLTTGVKVHDAVALPLTSINEASYHKKDRLASNAFPILLLTYLLIANLVRY